MRRLDLLAIGVGVLTGAVLIGLGAGVGLTAIIGLAIIVVGAIA